MKIALQKLFFFASTNFFQKFLFRKLCRISHKIDLRRAWTHESIPTMQLNDLFTLKFLSIKVFLDIRQPGDTFLFTVFSSFPTTVFVYAGESTVGLKISTLKSGLTRAGPFRPEFQLGRPENIQPRPTGSFASRWRQR